MEYALRHISLSSPKEFQLLDLDGHIAHTDGPSMFVVGLLSIFNELNIELSQEDSNVIDNYVAPGRGMENIFEIVLELPIEIGYYRED
jgi:hypothetical protein